MGLGFRPLEGFSGGRNKPESVVNAILGLLIRGASRQRPQTLFLL